MRNQNDSGLSTVIGFMLLILIIIIIIGVTIPLVYGIISDLEDSSMTNVAIFDVEYVNDNVIIKHDGGATINPDNIRIEINGVESTKQFESNVEKGDRLHLTSKPDGSEFVGGEKIDIIVKDGDSEYIIKSKVLN